MAESSTSPVRMTYAGALREYVEKDRRKRELTTELAAAHARLLVLEEYLKHQFAEMGQSSAKVDGTTVFLRADLYASAVDHDTDGLYRGLREAGYGDAVKETVNHQTLQSIVREWPRGEDGHIQIPEPLEGKIKVSTVYRIRTRRS